MVEFLSCVIMPKSTLNLTQKSEILRKLDEGVSGKRLAQDYNIAESTITYIKKQRTEILSTVANCHTETHKKSLRNAENPEMEDALYKWFLDQRARNSVVDGPILKAKAIDIFAKLKPDDNSFKASNGWLRNFKRRKGIRFITICGEQVSVDWDAIDPFIRQFRAKVQEMKLTNNQIYNADESGMQYKLLPKKTFVAASEKSAHGGKKMKDRISFMLCANSTATHKLVPLVIGKSAKPRCFSGFDNPLLYYSSKKAWMTEYIFTDWFHKSFVKEVSYLNYSYKLYGE